MLRAETGKASLRVAVVDRHEASRSGLARLLREVGMSVTAYAAASEVPSRAGEYDVVILDLDERDDPAALAALAERHARIIWTSVLYRASGPTAGPVLIKPLDVSQLLEHLATLSG